MENRTNYITKEFMWKTPILEKNHGHQGWREKNLLYEKLLQSNFVFLSHPKLQ